MIVEVEKINKEVNEMNKIPGFTAEASLYKAGGEPLHEPNAWRPDK